MTWVTFLAFVAGAFLFDWERLPPFTSLVVALVVVCWALVFGRHFRRD